MAVSKAQKQVLGQARKTRSVSVYLAHFSPLEGEVNEELVEYLRAEGASDDLVNSAQKFVHTPPSRRSSSYAGAH
jgi:hypothetical protein